VNEYLRKALKIIPVLVKSNPAGALIGGALELITDDQARIDNRKTETYEAAKPIAVVNGAVSMLALSVFSEMPATDAGLASSFVAFVTYAILWFYRKKAE